MCCIGHTILETELSPESVNDERLSRRRRILSHDCDME